MLLPLDVTLPAALLDKDTNRNQSVQRSVKKERDRERATQREREQLYIKSENEINVNNSEQNKTDVDQSLLRSLACHQTL